MRICFVPLVALTLIQAASAQWAFIPSASILGALESAKQIAGCEVAFPEFAGSTARYLRQAGSVVPGLPEVDAVAAASDQLLDRARKQFGGLLKIEMCNAILEKSGPQSMTRLACIVREEKRLVAFKTEFDQSVRRYFDQGPNLPCTGIQVKDLELKDPCERETAPIMIGSIEPNSPADTAGLLAGDILLEVANSKVAFWREPELAELRAGIGSDLEVSVKRGARIFQRSIAVGRRVIAPSESYACREK